MYRSLAAALWLVAGLLAAGGCAGNFNGMAAPETAKVVEKARTVGVISAVGSTFALQKVGITVFGNELNEVPIAAWGLDDAVASRLGTLLAKRFTVKRIAVPAGAFAAYDKPGGAFSDPDATLQGIVRKLAGSANCDLYLVITRAGIPFGGTNQVVAGIGMVEGGGALNPDNVTLYTVTTVHLYDGRSFERLVWQRPGFAIGGSIGNVVNAPHRTLDRTWWPAAPQAVHSEKIKSATRAVLIEGIVGTVPAMLGLAGAGKKGGA